MGHHGERRRHERRVRAADTAAALAIIAVGITVTGLLVLEGRSLDLGYYGTTPPTKDAPVWALFLRAAAVALLATVAAFAVGLVIGFATGWERATVRRPLLLRTRALPPRARAASVLAGGALYVGRRLADFYVELFRGTPLVVQMFFIWEIVLIAGPKGWELGSLSLLAGVLAMALNTGAYQSEIFRAGIQAVPAGQLEAARSVGLGRMGAMRHIVLPQALRLVLPPLTNEFVSVFKVSSLLFFIGVVEVTSLAKTLTYLNPKIFEIFLLTTAFYLAVTVPVSRSAAILERKFHIPGLGLGPSERRAAPRRRLVP